MRESEHDVTRMQRNMLTMLAVSMPLAVLAYYTYDSTVVHENPNDFPPATGKLSISLKVYRNMGKVYADVTLRNTGAKTLTLPEFETPLLYHFKVIRDGRALEKKTSEESGALYSPWPDVLSETLVPHSRYTRTIVLGTRYDLRAKGDYKVSVTYAPHALYLPEEHVRYRDVYWIGRIASRAVTFTRK